MNDKLETIISGWEEVSKEAKEKVKEAKDEFQKKALFLGGVFVIGGGLVATFDGGTVSKVLLGGIPLTMLFNASSRCFLETHFYGNLSKWASDQRDNVVISGVTDRTTKPRLDKEEDVYHRIYKQPSVISAFLQFRNVAIAGVVATALTAYVSNKEFTINLFDRNRNEDNDNNTTAMGSEFAPVTSPRPVPRPSRP